MRSAMMLFALLVAVAHAAGDVAGQSRQGPPALGVPAADKPVPERGLVRTHAARVGQAVRAQFATSDHKNPILPMKLEPGVDANETLQYDGPPDDGIGLIGGGTFFSAVRFTPVVACTVKKAVFYQYDTTSTAGYIYLFDQNTIDQPGPVLESVPYPGPNVLGWKVISFATARYRNANQEFWVGVRYTHNDGQFPSGCDAGNPYVPDREYITQDRTTWFEIADLGLPFNWNIRTVASYVPQANDMAALSIDGLLSPEQPNQWLTVRSTVMNVGTNSRTPGVQVILRIQGPSGYNYWDTTYTALTLAPYDSEQVVFSPNWRTPNTLGTYNLKVWSNLSGDQNRVNDTARLTLEVTNWLSYANLDNEYWLVTRTPGSGAHLGTYFVPLDFGLSYPITVESLGASFYNDPSDPWTDTTFIFKIYNSTGETLLYSRVCEAVSAGPGEGATSRYRVNPPLTLPSRNFMAAVYTVADDCPVLLGDNEPDGASYAGDSLGWGSWEDGEFHIAAFTSWNAPTHDAGFYSVQVPYMYVEPGASASPRGVLRNYGPNMEAAIQCSCFVHDTVTDTRIYSGYALATIVPAGESVAVTFSPAWTPPATSGVYDVKMFTNLPTDGNPANDTLRHRFFGFDVVEPLFAPVKTMEVSVDGYIDTVSEWKDANCYDISNILGYGDPYYRYFPDNVYMYVKHDSVRLYVAYDIPILSDELAGDSSEIGLYFDENHDGAWAADSSEGNYWAVHWPPQPDSIWFRGITPTSAWQTLALGAKSATSTVSGHQQYELSIPFGTAKWELNANPGGDTLGFRTYVLNDKYFLMAGWWQTTVSDEYWRMPATYGRLIIAPAVWPLPWEPGWAEAAQVPFENSNREVKDGGWLATMRDRGLIYGAKGNKSLDFYSYDAQPNHWTVLPAIPDGPEGKPAGKGSCGTADGENSIYFVKGNNTLEFYRFLVNEGRYETLQVVPEGLSGKKVKGGGDMVFARPVDTQYVYFLKGYKNEFYRFNTTDREWQTLPAPPGEKWAGGSFLAYDGDRTIYAHKSKDNALYSFDLVDNRWNSRTLTGMPLANRFFPGKEKKSKDGANGVWFEGAMYATKGGNTQEVWKYVPGTTRDSWSEVDTIPQMGSTMRRKRIKAGGDIASYGGGAFFITKGNKTFEFWRYVLPAADRGRDGVTAGGVSIADCRLTVAPNPLVRGFATVRLGGPAAAWPGALVRVFDMTGRCVLTRPPDPLTPGILTLDMRGLSAGVYVVSFRAGELSLTQKLAIEN